MSIPPKIKWQRQESRPVRPFRSANDYLTDVGLRLYADEDFKISETFQVPPITQEHLAVSVRIPALPLNFAETVGLSIAALKLIVTVEDRTFKYSGVAAAIPLSELESGGRVFDFDAEVVSNLTWAGETRIHVAVVLSESGTGEVGTAERIGSWVARKTFSVGGVHDTSSFPIDAVEPEYFEKRSLPRGTTYLVEISDTDLNQSCENLRDLVKVSLAKDVLSALAKDEESAMAKALVRTIYVDVATTVLSTGYSNLATGEAVTPNSILDVMTSRLTKSTGLSPEKLRVMASETAGSQLRAVVQADVEFSRSLISAAQRRSV
jgi:hypothetical protein